MNEPKMAVLGLPYSYPVVHSGLFKPVCRQAGLTLSGLTK